MKSKANLVFIAGCIVAGVLILVAGLLLGRAVLKISAAEEELATVRMKYERFFKQKPFAGRANVRRVQQNAKEVEAEFEKLIAMASKGQHELSETGSPSSFMALLRKKLAAPHGELVQLAAANDVSIREGFAFGFDSYFGGTGSPSKKFVPRLVLQFAIIYDMSKLLFSEGATEILEIRRDLFDARTAERRVRRGRRVETPVNDVANAGLIVQEDLFGKLHFVFRFKARERAVAAILNHLSAHRMFAVVTNLELVRELEDISPVSLRTVADEDDGAGEIGSAADLSTAERTICGSGLEIPMTVTLEVDVYRFRTD